MRSDIPIMVIAVIGVAGCGAQNIGFRDPIDVVRTRTPGVAFVVVHPEFSTNQRQPQVFTQADGTEVRADSADYILVCDARPADGMHCAVAREVAVERTSAAPQVKRAAVADVGVGVGDLPPMGAASSGVAGEAALRPGDSAPALPPVPPAPAPPPEGSRKGGKP